MKGTEKQIKWAEDIIEDARWAIDSARRENKKYQEDPRYGTGFCQYNDEDIELMGNQLEQVITMIGDDAKKVIDKRNLLNSDRILKELKMMHDMKRRA